MRNIIKKSICLVLSAVTTVGILSGCGGKTAAAPTDTVLLWGGKHANYPWVSSTIVYDDLTDTLQGGGTLTVIREDGLPSVVSEVEYEPIKGGKKEREIKSRLSEVQDAIGECTAQESGLDTLRAIQLAAQKLEGSSNKKKLIVVDSGFCTEPPFDLTQVPLSNVDVKSTITSLRDAGEIVSLTDCDVIWYGLGVTAGEQQPLTAQDEATLKKLYEEYFSGAGAKLEWRSSSIGDKKLEADVPPITPVPVIEEDNGVAQLKAETVFPESEVAFKDGSAELVDPAAAEEALQDIIKALHDNPDVQVYVTGTTTNADTPERCRALAKARAQVVADILTKEGTAKEQLVVVGFGAGGPKYTADTPENQNAANRSVSVIRADSDTGKQIAAGTWQYD